jgi:hypothetical protein
MAKKKAKKIREDIASIIDQCLDKGYSAGDSNIIRHWSKSLGFTPDALVGRYWGWKVVEDLMVAAKIVLDDSE